MGDLHPLEISIIPIKKPTLDKQTKEDKLSQTIIKPKSKLIYLNAIKYMNQKGKNTSPYGFGNTSKLILKHIKRISYENKI